jgi:hypothetical protein
MIVFLRWWLILWLSIAAALAAGAFGFYPYLWRSDATFLSWASLAVYAVMTAFIGQLTHRARRGFLQKVTQHLPLCWFTANTLLSIGMVGTLVGFLLLLQSLAGVGPSPDMQKVLGHMTVGFSTAGLTTIVGLVCSMLLKLQLINLQYLLRDQP